MEEAYEELAEEEELTWVAGYIYGRVTGSHRS